MKVDGACHSGSIRFEAEVDPAKVVICHCTDCQTLSGSTFRTVVPANEGTFRLLSGEPKVYVKTGREWEQARADVLPQLRLANLLSSCGRRRQSGCAPRRYSSPACRANPERPILVRLGTGLASGVADYEKEREATRLQSERWYQRRVTACKARCQTFPTWTDCQSDRPPPRNPYKRKR